MCKILYALYGRDTRSAQILNILLGLFWFGVFVLAWVSGNTQVIELPPYLVVGSTGLAIAYLVLVLISLLSYLAIERARQVLKSAMLLFGAALQMVLANGYFSEFPPLDIMSVVCVVLSLWLLGAVFYIVKCEGLDDITIGKHQSVNY